MGSKLPGLMITVIICATVVAYAADPFDQEGLDHFSEELEQLHAKLHLPGMAAAIVKDGELVWARGFGFADLEEEAKVTPDTPFRLASVTKTYASTILMHLVEQGMLDLDDPAADYGIRLQSRGTVTVRHLFSHTSEGNPGSRFKYNGDRYSLLDKIIEHVTGKSFAANLEELIITPLNLKNTAVSVTALTLPLAKPYRYTRGKGFEPGQYPQHFSPAAGLMSSVLDVAAFDIALDEGRFIRSEMLEVAWTPSVSINGREMPYGLGWFVQNARGTRLIWHYGWWPPHVSSLYLKVPEQHVSFVVLANSDGLSAKFNLHRGNVLRSPVATLFLKTFAF
jgi:CubicO group peptidase (beta-lactamase class C family)